MINFPPVFRGTFLPSAVVALAMLANTPLRSQDRPGEIDSFVPNAETDTSVTPLLLSIPPARGRILDRSGRIIADTRVFRQATVLVSELEGADGNQFATAVRRATDLLPGELKEYLLAPTDDELASHFTFRRRMPLAITRPLDPGLTDFANIEAIPGISLKEVYLRSYPHGTTAAHLLGYLGKTDEDLSGPVRQEESFWQPLEGRAGLEKAFEATLGGTKGKLILGVNADGSTVSRDILKAPSAGSDVVLSLDLPTQEIVERNLARAQRAGAAVFMDADTGDIIASASYPAYDPSAFVRGLSQEEFGKMAGDVAAPLFNRAVSAAYPPGSTFKPVVGLAVLKSNILFPFETLSCAPELEIDGRVFRNWSDNEAGNYDLRRALMRSHNSWFYQAAMMTRDEPILRIAKTMGFSVASDLPLEQIASGSLPLRVPSNQGLANLAIGQGEVSASPLQVAGMMAAFCNGMSRPEPRLVLQSQTRSGDLLNPVNPSKVQLYHSRMGSEMRYLRNCLYSVVNHADGTGRKARLENVAVCGKTGTSQWSRNGEESSMVWFAGFVEGSNPPISFAIALEGKPGERIFGGTHVAPVAGAILKEIFSEASESYVKHSPSMHPPRLQQDLLDHSLDTAGVDSGSGIPVDGAVPEARVLRALPVTEPGH